MSSRLKLSACEFNPDFHNAVMHVEDDSVGEGHRSRRVREGLHIQRPGYKTHAMVKVAN